MKSALLIAFHFPPVQGSSGVQRTLRFARHLPKFGWQPVVLSIDVRAYEAIGASQGNEVPPGVEVYRAFGLDTARQLSLFGRYPRALAVPDRWATWRFRAVPSALKIIRERNIRAVWSTFPIATAHLIGLEVARRCGLPWVAEFRDPMWQGDYPHDPVVNRAWQKLEGEIFARARNVVVTTPGAAALYAERFPGFDASRLAVIENGYDEEAFQRAAEGLDLQPRGGGPLTLLHSGIVYRSERDPTQLFAAIASLKEKKAITADSVRLVFRASGDQAGYTRDVERLGIADIVRFEAPIDYLAALREMLTVDGLLILQASNCNAQVPAKLYEYLRARRPILALTDPVGDTARTLQSAQAALIARLDSQPDIEAALLRFIAQIRDGAWRGASPATVASYSREAQAGQLARLLDSLVEPVRP